MNLYYENYGNVNLNEKMFLSKTFVTRYRSCGKIQQLSKYLKEKEEKEFMLDVDEEITPCLPGLDPVWIDIGSEHKLLTEAVKQLKELTKQFQRAKKYLLCDTYISEATKFKVAQAWGEKDTFLDWYQFTGCEADAVIYICDGGKEAGAACHEAISRSKQFLGIVTIKNRYAQEYFEFTDILR